MAVVIVEEGSYSDYRMSICFACSSLEKAEAAAKFMNEIFETIQLVFKEKGITNRHNRENWPEEVIVLWDMIPDYPGKSMYDPYDTEFSAQEVSLWDPPATISDDILMLEERKEKLKNRTLYSFLEIK